MERSQFTFYDSFHRAAQRIRNKTHRCTFYDVLTQYALTGAEPDLDALPDAVAIAFELSRPNLDASRRKATSGKRGGESRQALAKAESTGAPAPDKPEANQKQTESKREATDKQSPGKKENEDKKEKENKLENENKKEDECPPKSPFAVVLAAYANKINPTPSELALAELKAFVDDLGQECCLRAIDIALDEKKVSWSYIRAILKTKRQQGVKCLADWDRVDAQREAQKAARHSKNAGWEPGKPREPSPEELQRQRQDMERSRRVLAMMKEEGGEVTSS